MMNVLYVGSNSDLSLLPLKSIIKSGFTLCAIATYDISRNEFSAITAGSIQDVSLKNDIPIVNLDNCNEEIVEQVKHVQPDVILVSCFERLIPQSILSLAKKGAFNLHPSLLPAFRGPTPLFWQFKEGVDEFGVTIHRMNDEFDTGAIVDQKSFQMPEGIFVKQATELVAKEGCELILRFLHNLSQNKLVEKPQDENLSSYQSYPLIENYQISTSWPVKRIFNFISAYKESGVYFLCQEKDRDIKVTDVLSYNNDVGREKYALEGDVATITCDDGMIECKVLD